MKKKFISKHDAKKQQQPIMLQQYLIVALMRGSVEAQTAECLVARDSII